ncbi:MAG TPA: VacB/RNase II family 3'-5' exoribonuclease [Phycisphaerales bacterium]|nr:VacB/RNase II family 3'-5' exoribonuclease [Phycisphaerales bacterium]
MPGPFTRRVLEHLAHESYAPETTAQMAAALAVPPDAMDDFRTDLADLVTAGHLVMTPEGKIGLPSLPDEITGVFRKNAKGFGFVVPQRKHKEGDVYIAKEDVADALSGDTVKVRVYRQRRGGDEVIRGVITDVLTRKRSQFSGELRKQGTQWLVYPDGRELRDPVVVRDPQAKNAYEGHKVIVEITAYPESDFLPEGVITKVLGEAGRPDVETQATIEAFNLPKEFPQACIDQAREANERFNALVKKVEDEGFKDREDLRGQFILTIDPPDAKDYDDAISIERTESGGWKLGVHIADVAHFIPVGSPLDLEAKLRGNSCYLPRLVIPMLPEVLSNGICSLQEGVPRFCKSTFHVYDRHGFLSRAGVSQTLIQSRKRLTYLEAQALIDGDFTEARKHAKTEPRYTDELVGLLKEMDALAKAIRIRRRAAGMIHLDLPQVQLVYDDQGRVIDAEPEDDAFTHTLIEMFMVEANEVVARLFTRLKVPHIRRIHPEPPPGDVDNFRDSVKVAGFSLPKNPTRMELQKILDATKGTPTGPAVHFAILRTLTRAEYSPAPVGHYALASDAYSHFTSPIRRYADLTIHRAIAEYLRRTDNGANPPRTDEEQERLGEKMRESKNCPPFEELEQIGRAITMTEQNAAAAEDHLRTFLVMQLLSGHVGEPYQAIITGVSNNGIFVKLDKYLVEGLVKSADLPVGLTRDGRMVAGAWRIDQRTGALVNANTGRSFSAGERVTVIIAKVDLSLRQMELTIADDGSRDKGKAKAIYDRKGQVTGGAGEVGGGALNLDWEQIKYGAKSGAQARDQRSKQRDRNKKQHRRDKD